MYPPPTTLHNLERVFILKEEPDPMHLVTLTFQWIMVFHLLQYDYRSWNSVVGIGAGYELGN